MEPMKPIEPVQNLFLKQWFDENQDKLYETARYIFRHPELAEKETLSSRCLADYLERQGFRIRFGISGFETAFIAEWGSGTPILGFLAEYDALPGLCQPPLCHREQTDQPGHGCGHNLLGTACAGSAAALKALMVKEHLPGTLRVYGCPAEETVIGKIRMNQDSHHLASFRPEPDQLRYLAVSGYQKLYFSRNLFSRCQAARAGPECSGRCRIDERGG